MCFDYKSPYKHRQITNPVEVWERDQLRAGPSFPWVKPERGLQDEQVGVRSKREHFSKRNWRRFRQCGQLCAHFHILDQRQLTCCWGPQQFEDGTVAKYCKKKRKEKKRKEKKRERQSTFDSSGHFHFHNSSSTIGYLPHHHTTIAPHNDNTTTHHHTRTTQGQNNNNTRRQECCRKHSFA